MQVLDAIARRLRNYHEAEQAFANIYVHARGNGLSRAVALDNAARATRSRLISRARRRELVELVEQELGYAKVPVQ